MGEQKQAKLNWLQSHLPEGLLVDARWLQRQGYSSALRSKYVAHGWLDQVARSVYRRPTAELAISSESEALRWQYLVISMQTLLRCPVTVGGRTALELQGFAHYLSASGPREIHLYGHKAPPGWVSKLKLDSRLIFHNGEKLFEASTETGGKADVNTLPNGLTQKPWGHLEWPILMSSPERAILELLDEVPQRETFHQADVLMEGLRNLSPRRLHTMLVECRSIKVKRLFLWFAERHNHAWLKGLDRKGISLGQGKRMLVRGGKLDSKFQITVPGNLDAST